MYNTETAELEEGQLIWFSERIPKSPEDAIKMFGSFLAEIYGEITFEMFWDKYDLKVRSSKKKSLEKWNKMGEKDRRMAYEFMRKYFASLPYGTVKKNAETYLNHEQWNN